MNILIIGSGGREHAIGWKLRQSPQVQEIYFAPGNGGSSSVGQNIDITDIRALVQFARKNDIGMTVVGPEQALFDGIVDVFGKEGLPIFGPSKQAARLETSKVWAYEFMKRQNIPCPESYVFSKASDAKHFVNESGWTDFVIKVDGLALGKGVILADAKKQACDAIDDIMEERRFGDAGDRILIQEKLEGYELSIIAVADGKKACRLVTSQDHKRAFDHDKGPNTGGMGTYAPVQKVSSKLLSEIDTSILMPLMKGMKEEGYPYKGAIYPGLMITPQGPKVLEFNARFGDPETQPQMMLMKRDLLPILSSCVNGTLDPSLIQFRDGATVCVILASGGYPGTYEKGKVIHGLDRVSNPDVYVFHSGTVYDNGQFFTSGGRVLGVTAYGKNLFEAQQRAYKYIGKPNIHFSGMHYRKDIAWQSMGGKK